MTEAGNQLVYTDKAHTLIGGTPGSASAAVYLPWPGLPVSHAKFTQNPSVHVGATVALKKYDGRIVGQTDPVP